MKTSDITHDYGWKLDQGRKRKNNQDSLATAKMRQVTEDDTHSVGIYIVADGVAQSPDGQAASKLAVDIVMRDMLVNTDYMIQQGKYTQQMQQSVQLAHDTILQNYQNVQNLPATTLVMAMIIETTAYIINIGDSRAYVLSGDTLRQITTDHTYAQALVEAGAITQEEANDHPFSNALSRHLGGHDDHFEPDVFAEHLNVGDYLLLCSDGLYNLVSEDDIVRLIRSADSPKAASKALTQAANDAGGKDNIATIVVQIMQRD